MDKVPNDAAAEQARKELAAAIAAGLFSTRHAPRPRTGRKAPR
jgi:hypothetical protein